MKRLAAILLSALLLFNATACYKPQKTPEGTSSTSEKTQATEEAIFSPPSWEAPLFSSYDDIRYAIIKLEKHGGIETFEKSGIKLDSREQEIYDALHSIIGQPLAYSCRDDINSDDVDELIIWTNTYPRIPIAAFGMKDGKPVFLNGIVPSEDELTWLLHDITEWENPHYKIFTYEEYSDKGEKYEYEIYDKNGTPVKSEQTNSSIYIYKENDLLVISISSSSYTDGYSYRKFAYSISQNKFSDVFFDAWDFSSDKVSYPDNGVLTVQNIFDKSVFYEQYPEYQNPSSVYFDPDGKAISFYCYVENQRKPAIKTVCFEKLPIIRILYSSIPLRYIDSPFEAVPLSTLITEWAYLRSATGDTVRLLDTEPIKIESDGETDEFYKILYFGHEYCIYASDLIEITYYGDENESSSVNTKDEVIGSVLSSLPELKEGHNLYADDIYVGFNFTSPQNGYFFAFDIIENTFDVQLDLFLKTNDGGQSWQPITIAKPPVLNRKEKILCAKMINSEIGLISGRHYADDNKTSDRIYITTDGGVNWEKVELPTNSCFDAAEVYDFVYENREYYLCFRVLRGDSYENQRYEYFEYFSRDLKRWSPVERGK